MRSKLLLVVSMAFCIRGFAQTPQFTIQDLGSLPNFPACIATGLSQSGNVTGYCAAQTGGSILNVATTHGFLYSKGKMIDLNLTGQPTPIPMAVNDSNLVAGGYVSLDLQDFTASSTPFVDQNGSLTFPQGPMQGVLPFAANNAGQIVGSRISVNADVLNLLVNSQAVLYAVAGGATTILPAPTGQGAGAFGINSGGSVAGAAVSQGGAAFTAMVWENGEGKALGTLSGYNQSAATSINDSGLAAGYAFNLNFTELIDPLAQAHAVVFNTDGSVTDLGVLSGDQASMATGINNSGWVVGFSSTQPPDLTLHLAPVFYSPQGTTRAFLYANGKLYNLSTLVTNGSGWALANATAINNAGQITGTGILQTSSGPSQHVFLLTPVAAPPGPSITGVAGAGLSVPAVTSISTNGLFTIFGAHFTSTAAGINSSNIINNRLPTNLANTCVESGGAKLGLFFVSAGQINALAADLPAPETVPVSVPVSVVTNCGTANEIASPTINVPVAAVSPEFLYFVQNADGQNPIAAVDYTTGIYVGAPNLIQGATFAPVHAGDVVVAYGVGWGPTSSTDSVGTLASAAAGLTSKYSLTIGGMPATVSYAGLSPGSAGLYQINFTVPSGVPSGNQPLVLTVDSVKTAAKTYITVE